MPWAYTRSKLAEHWHCTPPEVDALPRREIALQLKIWALEDDAERFRPRPGR